ncbi:MAG: dihydrofolate reductase [Clostridia bacterium]|nr:dihydrofolate reductase [Clostridia bacterium]
MKAILHCDREWGLGKKNGLMFSLPADMKFFKDTTTGHVVVMGSNTLLSFPGGNPLKNRVNIVLWPGGEPRGDCTVVQSLDELFAALRAYPDDEIYVIGGAMMYRTLLPYCGEVLVTRVDAVGGADVFFPDLDKDERFVLAAVSEPVETGGYTVRFCTYRQKAPLPLPR